MVPLPVHHLSSSMHDYIWRVEEQTMEITQKDRGEKEWIVVYLAAHQK